MQFCRLDSTLRQCFVSFNLAIRKYDTELCWKFIVFYKHENGSGHHGLLIWWYMTDEYRSHYVIEVV
jgi:hypothetical protein